MRRRITGKRRALPRQKCCRISDDEQLSEIDKPVRGFRVMTCPRCMGMVAYLYHPEREDRVVYLGTFILRDRATRFSLYAKGVVDAGYFDLVESWAAENAKAFRDMPEAWKSLKEWIDVRRARE